MGPFESRQFSYYEETPENFASMRTDYYTSMTNTSVLFSPETPTSVDGLDASKELTYGTISSELDVRGYERGVQEDPSSDGHGLQGLWHGYEVYTPEFPQEGLTALVIYENPSENTLKGHALEPVGYSTFEGTRQIKDGRLLFNFFRKYDGYDIQYYHCGSLVSNEVEGDTLNGFWCANFPADGQDIAEMLQSTLENTSWASGTFRLHRKPMEFFLCRPDKDAFSTNRTQALWSYAISAIRYRVRSKLFVWQRMEARRAMRKKYVALFVKRSEDVLSDDESKELKTLIPAIAPEDMLYYRSLGRRAARRITT